eukprot:NODE_1656_length_1099_cov_100.725714_g985_i1.p1 GENE.NODE_1656_length_1099_cov_100.725714_g985_i1~~NODE_1656_length_1099_cov_100.725714_g985_i1.p1  ORF type:complete len:324 (+),score=111.25 NODE_1656_length_1099_cov_100.725714_g985_i1:140-973(+)
MWKYSGTLGRVEVETFALAKAEKMPGLKVPSKLPAGDGVLKTLSSSDTDDLADPQAAKWVVWFYTRPCMTMNTERPILEQLAKDYDKSDSVRVRELDVTRLPKMQYRFSLQQQSSIVLFTSNYMYTYSGDVTAEGLKAFVEGDFKSGNFDVSHIPAEGGFDPVLDRFNGILQDLQDLLEWNSLLLYMIFLFGLGSGVVLMHVVTPGFPKADVNLLRNMKARAAKEAAKQARLKLKTEDKKEEKKEKAENGPALPTPSASAAPAAPVPAPGAKDGASS